jgi:hypothetical protein
LNSLVDSCLRGNDELGKKESSLTERGKASLLKSPSPNKETRFSTIYNLERVAATRPGEV